MILLVTVIWVRPFIYRQFVGDYLLQSLPIYQNWKILHLDTEEYELIDFQSPYVQNWGIGAKYLYEHTDDDEIKNKYQMLIHDKGWVLISNSQAQWTYEKDQLQLVLSNPENHIWQIEVSAKGFNDKTFWEKLIYGNHIN